MRVGLNAAVPQDITPYISSVFDHCLRRAPSASVESLPFRAPGIALVSLRVYRPPFVNLHVAVHFIRVPLTCDRLQIVARSVRVPLSLEAFSGVPSATCIMVARCARACSCTTKASVGDDTELMLASLSSLLHGKMLEED